MIHILDIKLTIFLFGLTRGLLVPFILQYKPQALQRQCPFPSLLHKGVDVAAQFTHSRPSEKRSQKSETHVNSKSKSSKNYGMADIPPAQKHELACAFLSVRQHHTQFSFWTIFFLTWSQSICFFATISLPNNQIYRCGIPKKIFFWDYSLSVRRKPLQAEIYLFTFASGIVVRT